MITELEQLARLLPGYDIGAELGRGATGVVYAARHRHLERDVAVKLLPRAFRADLELKARFLSEARLLAGLDHPHIVPVYDYLEDGGLCLLVLEHLAGGSLWERYERGMSPTVACASVLGVLSGLEHAHQRGVLHRDVKPDNVLHTIAGRPKVADFGIAKLLQRSDHLTRAGDVLGTPAYMAPEQAQGRELGPSTDVYAVAVVLYELLARRLPFSADGDAMAVLWAHVYEDPPELRAVQPAVPPPVSDCVMVGLHKDPAERHTGAEEFAVALASAAAHSWGGSWLADSGVPVVLAPIVESAARSTPAAARKPLPPPVGEPRPLPVAVATADGDELAAREVAELRSLRRAMAGELGFSDEEVAEFNAVTGKGSPASRIGLRDDAAPATQRAVVLAAIARWRERGADPFATAPLREACDSITRAYESVYQALERTRP